MIFWFSGTGNSRLVAYRLARLTHDRLWPIARVCNSGSIPQIGEGEPVGFVFPTYGWDLPKVVRKMMSIWRAEPASLQLTKSRYVYLVTTCGDDTGKLDRRMAKAIASIGGQLKSAWSVIMPNTYICLPGFDVDSKVVEQKKLSLWQSRVEEIAKLILQRREGIWDITEGHLPWLKTYVLGFCFHQWMMSPKPFKVSDQCISCNACVRACVLGNIHKDDNGIPLWGGNCTMCLACYHHCSTHSISYGKWTVGKGQCLPPKETNEQVPQD